MLLFDCQNFYLESSFLLKEIVKIVVETEKDEGISLTEFQLVNNLRIWSLGEFLDYLNSWYFLNDLYILEMENWLFDETKTQKNLEKSEKIKKKFSEKNNKKADKISEKSDFWKIDLAKKLIKLCKIAKVQNCFELTDYFENMGKIKQTKFLE